MTQQPKKEDFEFGQPEQDPTEMDLEAQIFLSAVFDDPASIKGQSMLLDMSPADMMRMANELLHTANDFEDSNQRHLHNYRSMLVLMQHFARLAGKDGLTGLFNKRSFQDALIVRLDALQNRDRTTYLKRDEDNQDINKTDAVLFIDLDKFKPINDTYGHLVGDEVLVVVSNMLRTIRPNDLAARMGGDEFAVLLADVTKEEALQVKQRINEKLNSLILKVDYQGKEISVNIQGSIGMSILRAGMSPEFVEHEADSDMYATKQAKGTERKPSAL